MPARIFFSLAPPWFTIFGSFMEGVHVGLYLCAHVTVTTHRQGSRASH